MASRAAFPIFALILLLEACGGGVKGASDYNAGIDEFKGRDYARACERFEKAVAANPEFSEACVYLSTSQVRLAREAALAGRKKEAAALWRQSVASRRRAKTLMDEGKFCVSEGEAQERARRDVTRVVASIERFEQFSPTDEVIAEACRNTPDE